MSPGTGCWGAAPAGPGNSAAAGCWGAGRQPQHPARADRFPGSICSAGTGAGRCPTTKGRPAESAPARAAPPRLPASAPASPRESLPRHRLQVPGRGRGRGDNNPAGGRRGKARRRAPRQRGAGLRAVPPRHWSAPPLRQPLIGECSNSVSRRQRRCFSGDRGPSRAWSFAKAGRITLSPCGRTDAAGWNGRSANLARPCPCRQRAAEIYTHALPARARVWPRVSPETESLLRTATVRKRATPAGREAGMGRRATRRGCHPTGPGSECHGGCAGCSLG